MSSHSSGHVPNKDDLKAVELSSNMITIFRFRWLNYIATRGTNTCVDRGRRDLCECRRGLDDHMMIRVQTSHAWTQPFAYRSRKHTLNRWRSSNSEWIHSPGACVSGASGQCHWAKNQDVHTRKKLHGCLANTNQLLAFAMTTTTTTITGGVFCWVSLTSPRLQQWFDAEFGP